MARKKKVSKTLAAAKIDLDRRVEEGDEAATAIRDEQRKRAGERRGAKNGLKAARAAYSPITTITWTEAGRAIVQKMRAARTDYSGRYFIGEGDIAKVRKHISKWETCSGYGAADLHVGQILIITSAPYNPYGDGLRIDVLRGGDSIQGVPLARLVQIHVAEDDEEDEN